MANALFRNSRGYSTWFYASVVLFWLLGIVSTARINSGVNPSTDGTSEQLVGYSARQFAREGFFKNYLLPTYPPFGEGLDGKPRTEPFVYNHYLAGADVVLGLWIKVFGEDLIPWARIVPHTMTVIGVSFLCWQLGLLLNSAIFACLMFSGMMIARSLTAWSVCLYAHGYASAVALFALGLFVRVLRRGKLNKLSVVAAQGVVCGFFITWFAMDWVGGTAVAMAALALALKGRISKPAMVMGFSVVLGGLLAGVYQLVLSILYFGSFAAVVEDLRQWLGLRSGIQGLKGDAQFAATHVNHSLNYIIREFNKQAYGATGFTAFNLVGIGLGFVALGAAARVRTRAQSLAGVAAVILGYGAGAVWHTVMKYHAAGNLHFVVRHYMLLLVVTLVIVLSISLDLIKQSKRAAVN